MSDDNFISRWSRRKHAAKREEVAPAPAKVVPASPDVVPAQAGTQPPVEANLLPPIESLTPESDFTPFMGSGVDPGLKRAALKTLFKDPRFNVMDGMDVYVDDYSKADPLPEGWLEKMNQVARLGDYHPPAPVDEAAAAAAEEQKVESEQAVVTAPAEPPADTSEQGLPSSKSGES